MFAKNISLFFGSFIFLFRSVDLSVLNFVPFCICFVCYAQIKQLCTEPKDCTLVVLVGDIRFSFTNVCNFKTNSKLELICHVLVSVKMYILVQMQLSIAQSFLKAFPFF